MLLSVVIPAFNEERYLEETLASLNRAKALLLNARGIQVEVIVVDNDSDDSTAGVARAHGATVIRDPRHNVARARNAGAKFCHGGVIVFVDADTVVPDTLLMRIADAMSDETCFGGAIDTEYRPAKLAVRFYLQFWRVVGKLAGLAQGATQFYRREVFFALNGYDETLFMGEDVDLFWRLKIFAKGKTAFIDDIRVIPSIRRFDQWRLWRTLVWTNPFFILMFRRSKSRWHGWYSTVPR